MSASTPAEFPIDVDVFLASVAAFLKEEGSVRELEVLLVSEASVDYYYTTSLSDGNLWSLLLEIDVRFYATLQRENTVKAVEDAIRSAGNHFLRSHEGDYLSQAVISPRTVKNEKWREEVRDYLTGRGVNNQGRVRSDNIAARQSDGLLFRSRPEILLFDAFKRMNLTFAPLPVFVRGGSVVRRLEPDFVLVKDGVVMVVEIDGPNHRETPAEAHARLRPLDAEGAKVERISAEDCDTPEKANDCAMKVFKLLQKRLQQKA